jgi:hypothetical protein
MPKTKIKISRDLRYFAFPVPAALRQKQPPIASPLTPKQPVPFELASTAHNTSTAG